MMVKLKLILMQLKDLFVHFDESAKEKYFLNILMEKSVRDLEDFISEHQTLIFA